MQDKCATKKSRNVQKYVQEWEQLLRDLLGELENATGRVGRLKASVKIVRKKIASKEPFPMPSQENASTQN